PDPELVVLTRSIVVPDGEPESRSAAPSGRIPLTSRPLAAASAVAVVPARSAIAVRVSPRATTYEPDELVPVALALVALVPTSSASPSPSPPETAVDEPVELRPERVDPWGG